MFDAAPDPAVTPLDYMRRAWDEGWMRGLEAGRQERPTRSHEDATQPRIVVVVKAAAMVIVALAALAILISVVGGYLANMQAFNDLAALALP
ncbi:MAG: hypothetical protein Kow00120_15210 [Anaerolineae bacterium]